MYFPKIIKTQLLCICYSIIMILFSSDVELIVEAIKAVNLPGMPLQLLADILDKPKVKQVMLHHVLTGGV